MIQLIYGKNAFMRQQYVSDTIENFVRDGGARDEVYSVHIEPDTPSDELLLTMQNVSLFSQKKLTILYDFTNNNDIVDKLEQFCVSTDASNWLVLVDGTLQARSKVLSRVGEYSTSTVTKASQLSAQELVVWAATYVKQLRKNCKLSQQNAQYLVERVGDDQLLLASELKKLVSGIDDSGEITREYITELVEMTPQGSVFAMLDAMLAGKSDRAMSIFEEQVAQGVAPQQIFGMIVWQLTQLAIVVDSQQLSNKELTSTYGVSSFAVTKLRPIAKQLTKDDIKKIVTELVDADYQSRMNASADDAIEYIVSFITNHLNKKTAAYS